MYQLCEAALLLYWLAHLQQQVLFFAGGFRDHSHMVCMHSISTRQAVHLNPTPPALVLAWGGDRPVSDQAQHKPRCMSRVHLLICALDLV